jgi:endonuclease G
MKTIVSICCIFFTLGIISFQTEYPTISHLELPHPKENEVIIHHLAYTLSYNETHEQANWVAYELTKEETVSHFERTNKFIEDELVKTGSATNDDYIKSGYDRGHLAPAGDMGWSEQAMKESFYYSNMSPQNPNFNGGIWKKTEELTREWAIENNNLFIVTGPILTSNLPTIGPNKVSIPNYYYKTILDYTQPTFKAIAFLIPNKASKEPLEKYVVSIDSIEKLTGYDFYYQLSDSLENQLEKSISITDWTWKVDVVQKISSEKNPTSEAQLKTSIQCKGITKKKNRCQNKTHNSSGYCRDHLSQKP